MSKKAYTDAVRGPRTRYRSLSVNQAGRVATARAFAKDWRCVWFQKSLEVEEDGTFYRDDDSYVVTMFVDGVASVLFYVENRMLESVCFSFLLKPYQLEEAVHAMRAQGLGRLVRLAAEHTLKHAPSTDDRATSRTRV